MWNFLCFPKNLSFLDLTLTCLFICKGISSSNNLSCTYHIHNHSICHFQSIHNFSYKGITLQTLLKSITNTYELAHKANGQNIKHIQNNKLRIWKPIRSRMSFNLYYLKNFITFSHLQLYLGPEIIKSTQSKLHPPQSDAVSVAQSDDTPDSRKESDKKTVKTILSQLLPSATNIALVPPPFKSQEHYTLPVGSQASIVVYESEPSSIIAYALNSQEYKNLLDESIDKKSQSVEQSPSPVHRRRGGSEKDKSDNSEFVSSGEKSSGILSFLRSKESKSDSVSNSPAAASSDSRYCINYIYSKCKIECFFAVLPMNKLHLWRNSMT